MVLLAVYLGGEKLLTCKTFVAQLERKSEKGVCNIRQLVEKWPTEKSGEAVKKKHMPKTC